MVGYQYYYLYNQKSDTYNYGFNLCNLKIDQDRKLLRTTSTGGQAGKLATIEWFDLVGSDSLRIIKRAKSKYIDSLESYEITRTQYSNGQKYLELRDTVERDRLGNEMLDFNY